MLTIKIFNEVRNRLAFAKEPNSMMRGYIMAKFLEAKPNTKQWCEGMSDDQAIQLVKESCKQWSEVYRITKCLPVKDNADLRKCFNEAHTYFVDKVKMHHMTSVLARECE